MDPPAMLLLGIARSSRPANDNDLALMRRIDELFTAWPFLSSRRMAAMLKAEGLQVNRKPMQRLMCKMGIAALGPKPNTTKPAPGHKIYPYLLLIDRPNRCGRPTSRICPSAAAFSISVAIIDWASRAVLAWRLSNTMDVSFCVAALEEALAKYGTPEIFNTEQGSQFTSAAVTGALVAARRMDNVFIERLWRSQARGHLSQGLCRRPRGQSRDRGLDRHLQLAAFIRRSAIARRWRSGANGWAPRRLWTWWTTLTR